MPLVVVYEDAHLIVIDKPAGLAVHPGPGHATGTLVNALIAHCGESLSGIGGVRRPGIVHRLDKDTTGLLVVAKTDKAHAGLAEQFAAHGADGRLERRYRALAWGAPERPRGAIDAALARSNANRTKIAVVAEAAGRHAVTRYTVLETYGGGGEAKKPIASLLELELETGRTHQIRVHLAHVGHPLLGDMTYGAGFKASARNLVARGAGGAGRARPPGAARGRPRLRAPGHAQAAALLEPAAGRHGAACCCAGGRGGRCRAPRAGALSWRGGHRDLGIDTSPHLRVTTQSALSVRHSNEPRAACRSGTLQSRVLMGLGGAAIYSRVT